MGQEGTELEFSEWPDQPGSAGDSAQAPSEHRPCFDTPRALAAHLRQILAAILADAPDDGEGTPDEIATDVPFTDLGITSVDFLEFVITLEEELDTEVSDKALLEPSLLCLDDWADYLFPRLQVKARADDDGSS